ncbi:MAG: APC family permease [Deltaproteobacteria bacterium]|nr:APC family permease [Deltaproteobacteria bacterium]
MAQETGLKKNVLGFPSLFAAAVGLCVASTTLVMLCQGYGLAGYGFVLATGIALVLMICQCFSFSELALMLPRAGSISSYTEVALGHFPAIISVLAGYVLVQCLSGASELAIAGIVLNQCVWPGISPTALSIAILVALTLLNMVGVDVFAWFQMAFTWVMIGTLLFLGFVGVCGPGDPTVHNVSPPLAFWDVIGLVALGIWLVIGAEFTCALVEEAKNPRKHLPAAMIAGLFVVAGSQLFFGMASFKYFPFAKLAASAAPHVDLARALLGNAGLYWVALASFCATASTMNTVLAAVPRMLYGMAHAGQVPAVFKWLHPRFRTPWAGILFMFACPFGMLLTGIATVQAIVTLTVAAAFCWLVSYVIAHLNVVILRRRYPALDRPFRTPLYPLPQLVGVAGIVTVLLNIFPDPAVKLQIYRYALAFLAAAAVYAFLWVRFKMGRKLFEPVPMNVALEE